ncbi:MAG: glycosyltransferase family 2 protein, partial [Thaumarchaeota archaeon]|nr:glycosyltransferase family 2 protein [Nitrososphaerota archaeon]
MFSLDSIATGLALLSLLGSVLVTSYLVITEEEAPVFRESISKLSFKDSRDVRVSIIIPARNEEQMIGDCLISLSKQTHQNIEVIVVDDS